VEDDAMNVLCLGGRVIGPEAAAELIAAFLGAQYRALDRYERCRRKVEGFERGAPG
jgi:ribose 5-phosphate isomerase B